jgi:hypothetical protein
MENGVYNMAVRLTIVLVQVNAFVDLVSMNVKNGMVLNTQHINVLHNYE